MLEEKLQKDLQEAMKLGNTDKVSAIRSIKAAIQNEKTNGSYHDLNDDDIVRLILKLSKQRNESYQIYHDAGRNELAEKELVEKKYLDNYLPKMLDENELKEIIDEIVTNLGATSIKDMGKVMKELSSRYPNQYNGQLASNYIKTKFN